MENKIFNYGKEMIEIIMKANKVDERKAVKMYNTLGEDIDQLIIDDDLDNVGKVLKKYNLTEDVVHTLVASLIYA